MTEYLRQGGTARLVDGAILTWTVAEGARGRRWRAVSTVAGAITHALLLEVDLSGRFARFELSTSAGLLTLHPSADGATLHGNRVTPVGIEHLAYDWGAEHGLSVDGRPIADAVTARRLTGAVRVGDHRSVTVVAVAPDLTLREEAVKFEAVRFGLWRVTSSVEDQMVRLDDRGILVDLADSVEWALEAD